MSNAVASSALSLIPLNEGWLNFRSSVHARYSASAIWTGSTKTASFRFKPIAGVFVSIPSSSVRSSRESRLTSRTAVADVDELVTLPGDCWCRPRQRQALLHWAYYSRSI